MKKLILILAVVLPCFYGSHVKGDLVKLAGGGVSLSGSGGGGGGGGSVNLTGHVNSVGNVAVLGSFTSAQFVTAVTGETGTGAVVLAIDAVLTGLDADFGTAQSAGNRLILPSGTTSQLEALDNTAGSITYDLTRDRPTFNNGTGVYPIAIHDKTDLEFLYGDAEHAELTLTKGQHATFGNTDSGASLTCSVASGEASKVIKGTKYFACTGGAANDYVQMSTMQIPSGMRDNGSGFVDLVFRFRYKYAGGSNAIAPALECVDGASAGEIAHLSITPRLDHTDYNNNGAHDISEGAEYEIAFRTPKDCTRVKFGFHWKTFESGAELIWDEVTFDTLKQTVAVETIGESEEVRLNGGAGHGSIDTKIRRFLNVSTNTSGKVLAYVDSAAHGTTFTCLEKSIIAVSYQENVSASRVFGITKNATQLATSITGIAREEIMILTAGATSAVTVDVHSTAWTGLCEVNDVIRMHTEGVGLIDNTHTKVTVIATPFRNKAIAVTGSQHMAGHYGSITWAATSNCDWRSTTAAWTTIPPDAHCDDKVRVKTGLYNTTEIGAGETDGRFLKIEFSDYPKGSYNITLTGRLKGSGGLCMWRFSDGTEVSGHSPANGAAGGDIPNLSGTIYNPTDQTNVTFVVQGYGAMGSCRLKNDTAPYEGTKISVEYMPPDTLVGKGVNYMLPTIDVGGLFVISGRGNDNGVSSTTVDVDFTEVIDTYGVWDGDSFLAPFNGYYSFDGSIVHDRSSNYSVNLFVDDVVKARVGYGGTRTSLEQFSGKVYLRQGQKFSIRTDGSDTLDDSLPLQHWIEILGTKDSGPTSRAHIISQPTCTVYRSIDRGTDGGVVVPSGGVLKLDSLAQTGACSWFTKGPLTGDTDYVSDYQYTSFTLAAGTYDTTWSQVFHKGGICVTRLLNARTQATTVPGHNAYGGSDANSTATSTGKGTFTIGAATAFTWDYACSTPSGVSNGLGPSGGLPGYNEVYGFISFTKKR